MELLFLALCLPLTLCSGLKLEDKIKRARTNPELKRDYQWRVSKGCPQGWVLFGHSCYFYGDTLLTWDDAQRECIKERGYLAVITSSEENDFVRELWHFSGTMQEAPWLGATDRRHEGVWTWAASGKPMEFTYWHEMLGEPNGGSQENCLNMHRSSKLGRWNDSPCMVEHAYICETEEWNF